MRLDTKFTDIVKNTADRIRRLSYLSTRERTAELAENMKRELYGMNMREQLAAKRLLSQAGQTVAVCNSAIAFRKDGIVRFLEKGSQVKLSNRPLQLDESGNIQVVLHDYRNKSLVMNLSDYLAAIDTSE